MLIAAYKQTNVNIKAGNFKFCLSTYPLRNADFQGLLPHLKEQ
jgi:hypothetical protein